ncbi:MAG: hypothetical protein ACXADC_07175 [Candidatus Thorarchaeota archaeon]|jgi:hypothetical protein
MNDKKEREQEIAIRAVHIIQTVVENLDEKGKRVWRKILGLEGKKPRSKGKKP